MTRQNQKTLEEMVEELPQRRVWLAQPKKNVNDPSKPWEVKKENGEKAVKDHPTQKEAWEHAKEIARNEATQPKPAGARKKGTDGQFIVNRFYPHPSQKDDNYAEPQQKQQQEQDVDKVKAVVLKDGEHGKAGQVVKADPRKIIRTQDLQRFDELERTLFSDLPEPVEVEYTRERKSNSFAGTSVNGEYHVVIVIDNGDYYIVGQPVREYAKENPNAGFSKDKSFQEAKTTYDGLPAVKSFSPYVINMALRNIYEDYLEEIVDEETETTRIERSNLEQEILDYIEINNEGNGVPFQKIIDNSSASEEKTKKAINRLLTNGDIYENKPGTVKKI